MLDYKVDYDNHPLFASGNNTCSRRLNYAVLLKQVYTYYLLCSIQLEIFSFYQRQTMINVTQGMP